MKQLIIPVGNGSMKLLTPFPDCFEVSLLHDENACRSSVVSQAIINVTAKRGEKFYVQVSNPCATLEECRIGLLPNFVHAFIEKYKAEIMEDIDTMPNKTLTVLLDMLHYPAFYCYAMPLEDVDLMRNVIMYIGTRIFNIADARGFEIQELQDIKNEYEVAIFGQEEVMHALLKDAIMRNHFYNLTRAKAQVYFNAMRKKLNMLKNHGLIYDI